MRDSQINEDFTEEDLAPEGVLSRDEQRLEEERKSQSTADKIEAQSMLLKAAIEEALMANVMDTSALADKPKQIVDEIIGAIEGANFAIVSERLSRHLNNEDAALLVLLENAAVTYRGVVNVLQLPAGGLSKAKRWNRQGYIKFGRIAEQDATERGSHYVQLSNLALRDAQLVRINCIVTNWLQRDWKFEGEDNE